MIVRCGCDSSPDVARVALDGRSQIHLGNPSSRRPVHRSRIGDQAKSVMLVDTVAHHLIKTAAEKTPNRYEQHARRFVGLSAREPQGEYLEWAELDGHCAVVNGKCRLVAPAFE
jgi:hypothetical protein